MTIEEARKIAKEASWVQYRPQDDDDIIQLDGDFSIEELEAFIVLMKAKAALK